jgi:hypothetical protein
VDACAAAEKASRFAVLSYETTDLETEIAKEWSNGAYTLASAMAGSGRAYGHKLLVPEGSSLAQAVEAVAKSLFADPRDAEAVAVECAARAAEMQTTLRSALLHMGELLVPSQAVVVGVREADLRYSNVALSGGGGKRVDRVDRGALLRLATSPWAVVLTVDGDRVFQLLVQEPPATAHVMAMQKQPLKMAARDVADYRAELDDLKAQLAKEREAHETLKTKLAETSAPEQCATTKRLSSALEATESFFRRVLARA